jgi:glycosyltransferase involved in cell wall biosynthesis
MNSYNYSIIIPHKNIPDLLQRCLNSIPEREDIQIIIIDDNSDPEIVDFSFFPGQNKKNIEIVYSKKGGGAGFARNLGLQIAKGKWILFSDADDFFNDCLYTVLDEYIDDPADIVYFKNNSVHNVSNEILKRGEWLNEFIDIYLINTRKGEKLLRYLFVVPWAKLIRKDLIDKYSIKFEKTRIHEDIVFSYLSGFFANSIKADSRKLYCWVNRENSLSQQKKESAIILDKIYVYAKAIIFYRNLHQGIRLKKMLSEIYFYLGLFYKNNKLYFTKAKNILLDIGFTNIEIFFGLIFSLLLNIYNGIKKLSK